MTSISIQPKTKRIHQSNGEHCHQVALFDWAQLMISSGRYPQLEWMYAIPNGGMRSKAVAGKLKAEGVKSGVFDIFLPVARHGYHGMYIEMKYGKNKLSDKQRDFKLFAELQGYFCVVCWDWEEAAHKIENYLKGSQ